MNHVIQILDIYHKDKDGNILWEAHNLPNMLHIVGEEFMLKAVFTGGVTNTFIPANYYFGLDNRVALVAADTLATTAVTEPTTNGYARVPVSSTAQFTVAIAMTGHNVASSPLVTFQAVGGNWGPVTNLFMATTINNTGYLIASVPLLSTQTVTAGNTLSGRIGLGLKDCP